MNKPIYNFFSGDHRRVDSILEESKHDPYNLNYEAYNKFRVALLTHIKMEENILFPAAKKANGGKALPDFDQLRLEHAALTTLMAVHPTQEIIKVIEHLLEKHDELEERSGGIYDVCDHLTATQTEEILEQLENIKPTPLHDTKKDAYVMEAAKRVLTRAGYDYDEIVNS